MHGTRDRQPRICGRMDLQLLEAKCGNGQRMQVKNTAARIDMKDRYEIYTILNGSHFTVHVL